MNSCLVLRDHLFGPDLANADDVEWVEHLRRCGACRSALHALPAVDPLLAQVCQTPVTAPSFEAIASAAAGAARRQRRRKMMRRSVPFLCTGLAAALVAAVVVMGVVGRGGSRSLLQAGSGSKVIAEPLSAVLASGARLQFDTGMVKLELVDRECETLELSAGGLSLEVPKFAETGCSLLVRTPDAEVRIRGARLQVTRSFQSIGADTQVHVVEGLVEVRPEGIERPVRFVHAGETVTISSVKDHRTAFAHWLNGNR